MNAEEILKTQRALSVASGTKRVTIWLAIGMLVIGIIDVLLTAREPHGWMRALASSSAIVTVLTLLRGRCQTRIRELEAALRR